MKCLLVWRFNSASCLPWVNCWDSGWRSLWNEVWCSLSSALCWHAACANADVCRSAATHVTSSWGPTGSSAVHVRVDPRSISESVSTEQITEGGIRTPHGTEWLIWWNISPNGCSDPRELLFSVVAKHVYTCLWYSHSSLSNAQSKLTWGLQLKWATQTLCWFSKVTVSSKLQSGEKKTCVF